MIFIKIVMKDAFPIIFCKLGNIYSYSDQNRAFEFKLVDKW